MEKNTRDLVRSAVKARKRYREWLSVFLVLSIFVGLFTMNILSFNGIALSSEDEGAVEQTGLETRGETEKEQDPAPTLTDAPAPTEEPTPTPEVTPEPTPETTPVPTEEPAPTPTPEVTPEPTPVPTEEPAPTPTPEVTPEPTPVPTEEPKPTPTPVPSPQPSEKPKPVSDPTADLESLRYWNAMFANQYLTGNWGEDLVAVAMTQLGYPESAANFELDEDGVAHGYTRYGAWYGLPYGDWCAMFISFCLHYADVPESAVPRECGCTRWVSMFRDREMYAAKNDYLPKPGDILFFDFEGDGLSDHVGIVSKVTADGENDAIIETIEGNRNPVVAQYTYSQFDYSIMGYGIMPENPALNASEDDVPEVIIQQEDPTEALPAQSFDGRANRINVHVEAGEGAFPEGTTMKVTSVKAADVLDTVNEAVKGEVVRVQAVDITFFNADGDEIEPKLPITVTMTPDKLVESDSQSVVHISDEGEARIVDQTEETEDSASEYAFVSDEFSTYAIVYTVDFTYSLDGRIFTFSLPGGESIWLSELVEALGLLEDTDFDSADEFVGEVKDVRFSDESLVKVAHTDADWLLESLQPFESVEQLTITMNNGDVLTVKVTDEQYTDITPLLSSVSISGAAQNPDGSYTVYPGTSYNVSLRFEETPSDTFNRSGSVTYHLPSGVTVPHATSGRITPSDPSQAAIYSINYTVAADGTVTFTWDVEPGKEQDFLDLPGLFIGLDIQAVFSENVTTVDWHGKATVNVDGTHDVGVSKSASLGQDGYMYYTVTVTSTGDNTNISLADTISGTALTLDQSSITEETDHGASFSNISDNGFSISIPELKHGETAVIRYRAQVDYDVLAAEAGVEKGKYGTVATTGNTVALNGSDDNPNNDTDETHADHNISFSSAGKTMSEGTYDESTGKRTLDWQIRVNDEHQARISYIHDAMGAGADKMSYSGEGIRVKVVNPDWSEAASFTVPWSQLGVNGNSTEWTYTIPDQYKDKNYSFIVEYSTEVDVSDSIVPVSVGNDVDTDYNEGHSEGKAEPAPGSKLDMEKTVAASDIPGGTVTWNIVIDVPANGLDSCVVTDTLPNINGSLGAFTDGFNAAGFNASEDVHGLIDGETVSVDASQPGTVVFTFSKGGEPGLYPVEGGRQVTITLTTTLDEDWMALEIDQDYLRYYNTHTNTALLAANGYTVQDSASITVNSTDPDMIKRVDEFYPDSFHWQNYDASNNLKGWLYRLYLYGVSDNTFENGYMVITDTFDDRYLAYYDSDNENVLTTNGEIDRLHQKLTHGTENGQFNDPVAIEATVSGGTITFRIPQSAFLTGEGNYDRYYHISYFLHVKDIDTVHQMDEDAKASGGTLKIGNTAVWAYSEPTEAEVEHRIPIISKDYTATAEEEAAGKYNFEVKVNENGDHLGTEEYLVVKDSYTNLTIDYATLECDPPEALLSYTHSGNTVTYYIQNGVPVTLRYTAYALESGAFSNTVEVNGQSVTKEGNANITSRGTTGAHEAKIKILKHSGSNMLEGISGVEFQLYLFDSSFPNNYDPAAPVLHGTYQTGPDGMFTIEHIPLLTEGNSYTTTTAKYVLHEVAPPEGYKALSHDYYFTVDTQTAVYGQYIYLNDDTLPISNEPELEDNVSVTVKKLWPDGDADLPELIRVRLYQKDSRLSPASSAQEIAVAEITRGADGSWTHVFTGLEAGKAYFVKEDPIEGYTANYSGNNVLGLEKSGEVTVTNTKDEPNNETISITVRKKWMEGENEITDIQQKQDLTATVELVRYRTLKSVTAVHFYHVGDSGWTHLADGTIPQGSGVIFGFTTSATYSGGMGVYGSIDQTKPAHESQGTSLVDGRPGQADGNSQTITVDSTGYDDLYVVWQYNSPPDISGFQVVDEGSSAGSGEAVAEIDPTYTDPETLTLDRENGWRASFLDLPVSGTGSDDGRSYSYSYGIREISTSDPDFAFDAYSVDVYEGEGSDNATVAIESGSTVTVTNKKEPPHSGSLRITKTVTLNGQANGTSTLTDGVYTFTVYQADGTTPAEKLDGSAIGELSITVSGGEPAPTALTVEGLAPGDYVVMETGSTNSSMTMVTEGVTGYDAEKGGITVTVNADDSGGVQTAAFTNNCELTDYEFLKEWHDYDDQATETWGGDITVTLRRQIGTGTAETVGRYTIHKTDTGFVVTKDTAYDDAPDLAHVSEFRFRAEGLVKRGEIGGETGEYVYFVTEETVSGYRPPSYSNPSAAAPDTWITSEDGALNGGKIINRPEGSYELPMTGGSGTGRFTFFGAVLILSSAALYGVCRFGRRRREGCDPR